MVGLVAGFVLLARFSLCFVGFVMGIGLVCWRVCCFVGVVIVFGKTANSGLMRYCPCRRAKGKCACCMESTKGMSANV